MSTLVDVLLETRAATRADPHTVQNPFLPTTIVVQSFGIGQWLKHQIALKEGISANIECILPAELVWRLYQAVLDKDQLPSESAFSQDLLNWHIMQILPTFTEAEFAPIQHYLMGSGDEQLRCFQLSKAISGLFDQYLVFRPDWLKSWEQGLNDDKRPWQSILWRALLKRPKLATAKHRAHLHNEYLNTVAKANGEIANLSTLPQNISLFGLSSLPAVHMQVLRAVEKQINFDIYFLNPCEHYWGDIVSEKDLAKRSIRKMLKSTEQLQDQDYYDIGNPILASTGKQGREYLELLLETDAIHTQENFKPNVKGTLLGQVQNDILKLEIGSQIVDPENNSTIPKLKFNHDDISIQIHSTHSRLREVEILYDQLLGLIESNLKLQDIMVMAPNISEYAPFIKTVFNSKLRYAITDQALNEHSAVISCFENILKLPDTRFTSVEIMDLLEVPAIARKQKLQEGDLETITYWIKESGIRWEMSGQEKLKNWDLPPNELNTWVFGLKRLVLGFAMDADVFDDIAPFSISAGEVELLTKLLGFIDLLQTYRKNLGANKSAQDWSLSIIELLDKLFLAELQDEAALDYIRDLAIKFEQQHTDTEFQGTVSPKLMRHWMSENLSNKRQTGGFISGGITFANLMPMRSVPYKAICLIGLNDKEFPREETRPSFDLMKLSYRKGDRSIRMDDHYLFLEALLSAEQYFYLSYQGRSIKDNKERPASILISELNEYLARISEHKIETSHPLQPFNAKYFDPAFPELKSYNQSWYQALLQQTEPKPFVDEGLKASNNITEISLSELGNLFRHPAKYFLSNKMGITFDLDKTNLQESESFSLDGLENYQLADNALTTIVDGSDIGDWEKKVRAEGLIIPGKVGDKILKQNIDLAEAILEKLEPHLRPEEIYQSEIEFSNIKLKGSLRCLGEEYVDYQSGVLRQRQLISIWINHLFRNATGYESDSYIISRHHDSKKKNQAVSSRFLALAQEEAKEHLAFYVNQYSIAQNKPIAFLPETSANFYDSIVNGLEIDRATEKALQSFTPSAFGSEGNDSYNARLYEFPEDWSEDFQANAHTIFEPMRNNWEKIT